MHASNICGKRKKFENILAECTEFFNAKRLGLSALMELDTGYGKLVKKCLDCNFGVSGDLDSVELQNAIVVGTVNELDKCIEVGSRVNGILGP